MSSLGKVKVVTLELRHAWPAIPRSTANGGLIKRFPNSYRRAFLLLLEGKEGCVKHGMQQGNAAACPGRSLWPPQLGSEGTVLAAPGALPGWDRRLALLPRGAPEELRPHLQTWGHQWQNRTVVGLLLPQNGGGGKMKTGLAREIFNPPVGLNAPCGKGPYQVEATFLLAWLSPRASSHILLGCRPSGEEQNDPDSIPSLSRCVLSASHLPQRRNREVMATVINPGLLSARFHWKLPISHSPHLEKQPELQKL
ncbi:hypothetical protein EK904_012504 [Melospiza melodia maxima]|nr:hypothetical protein EK904_012504 [Melospiza melodia maxima]